MAFDFDKIKSGIISAGKEVGDAVTDASNTAKIKFDIKSKEDFIEKQFTELGRLYYNNHKDDEEPTELGDFASIKEAYAEIDRLNDELLTIKGAVVCPQCGVKQSVDEAFCANCGAALK